MTIGSAHFAPAAIVPVPASQVIDLRGRRAIIGEPGKGWRGDLRTDTPDITHGEPTHVPILAELDFYRAEIEQREVFVPLAPIGQVWIEQPCDDQPIWPGAVTADKGVASLDAPPVRHPVPAADLSRLAGQRVVLMTSDGAERELRALSEPYQDNSGRARVNVCPERDWYAWALTGATPEPRPCRVHSLWVE